MATIYKYRLQCTTDNIYEYIWGTTPPTLCPTNSTHTIDTNSIAIVDQVNSNLVTIKEESVKTGGNFGCATIKIEAIKNTTSFSSISWPHAISGLQINLISGSENSGDIVNGYVGKDTIIGYITNVVTPAGGWTGQNYTTWDKVTFTHPIFGPRVYTCILDTVSNENPTNTLYWMHGLAISVSSTVIAHTMLGYYLKLDDLTNQDECNRVVNIDAQNNMVYVETNPTNSYSPASPTYIRQTVYTIKNYEFGIAGAHSIGGSKIGGSYIPKDVPIGMSYQNKSLDTDKTMVGIIEYLY